MNHEPDLRKLLALALAALETPGDLSEGERANLVDDLGTTLAHLQDEEEEERRFVIRPAWVVYDHHTGMADMDNAFDTAEACRQEAELQEAQHLDSLGEPEESRPEDDGAGESDHG